MSKVILRGVVGLVRRVLFKRLLRSGQPTILTPLLTLSSIVVVLMFYFNFHSNKDTYAERTAKFSDTRSHEVIQPNRTWLKLRKELLAKNDTTAKVVLFGYMRGGSTLFSEVFNLNPSTDVMWHEPMDAFFQSYAGLDPHSIPQTLLYYNNLTRRQPSDYERSETTNYLENLLNCRPESLPVETFAHFHLTYSSAFKDTNDCMERKRAKVSISNCTQPLRQFCGFSDLIRRDMAVSVDNRCQELIAALKSLLPKNSLVNPADRKSGGGKISNSDIVTVKLFQKLHRNAARKNADLLLDHRLCIAELETDLAECVRPAFDVCNRARTTSMKLIRVLLEDLEPLIQRVPDLHVIYYVRDPRAVATSRANPEAHLTMLTEDRSAVTEAKILCMQMKDDLKAQRYLARKYPGSVRIIRYESFVRSPLRYLKDVFERIGRPLPENTRKWLSDKFNGSQDNGIYGTVRVNPVRTSVNWMSEATLSSALEMERHCRQVLRDLGYPTFVSESPNATYRYDKNENELFDSTATEMNSP